jgi:hypothetical protein
MYLLDANVFIQAKNSYYGFDIVPAFWEWLVDANERGLVASIEKVAEELRGAGDELADWVNDRDDTFFLTADAQVVVSMQAGSAWVTTCGAYDQAAVSTYLQDSADYYLVSHAHAYGHVVVTHEIASTSRKRVKIPDACTAMGVNFTTPFDALRATGARFVKA